MPPRMVRLRLAQAWATSGRVLKIARQPYYRWLACPVTYAELEQAHLANALFDAHRDDPEFGYRFLVDEARDAERRDVDEQAARAASVHGVLEQADHGKNQPDDRDVPTGDEGVAKCRDDREWS